ncbi:HD domain-containing phosphohydrolase [Rhodoferax sp. BLA1]|uniref:HD domain-containing phosphohydrolase n=1 Tax=Rhodoferax sp. BLA1 TaxID=2576062 RepID=UPI0015D39BF4|nr:HD domain-containing phosphohydrolase [Rhodoferax sp. BLA1]
MPASQKTHRILACDNADLDTAFLLSMLEADGYSNVTGINDAREVLALLQRERFDLLVLDMDMPFIDGVELTRLIREQFSEASLPILVITASADKEARNLALFHGANDYLSKPVDSVETSLRVRNLLTIRDIYKGQQDTEQALEHQVKTRTAKLDMLIRTGIMMASEHDRTRLLDQILLEGQKLLQCDGATLYLVTDDKTLRFAHRTRDDQLPVAEIPLYQSDTGQPDERFVSTYVALHNTPVLIDDVALEARFDLSGTRRFDEQTGYKTVSLLTVPLASITGEVVGVLQFMNALDATTGQAIPFAPGMLHLVQALAAQAVVALDNLQLMEAQEQLMDNLFQMIATAIDAKSPYTGRHCNRVPELALILAQAAHDDQTLFADFRFETADQWREFKMGAWLHDCGKVTTPEYVIDKATKLETINNRIHEIRTRFEVLLRDAEISRLLALKAGQSPEQANARYAARATQLQDDFAFLAACNTGTRPLSAQDLARLTQLAAGTWLRHFDDRLGLSVAEAERRANEPVQPLPVTEPLLADKTRHLFERDSAHQLDPRYGFKMEVPEKLYNHGELYNLSVVRGTLTLEERFKINEHMISTVMMLENMRFPKSLRRVPEYASTHHETLTGTGYPRRLGSAELSIPSRIMAIADIFEALTAPDRPYKQPNTVSEAIKVLFELKQAGQIDADLFDLFLSSRLYVAYANKFLKPEQIDEVDIAAYLGTVTH